MDGAIGKLVFVVVAVGGIAWGFSGTSQKTENKAR